MDVGGFRCLGGLGILGSGVWGFRSLAVWGFRV